MGFSTADARKALGEKASDTALKTWVKTANKALSDGKSEADATEAATALAKNVKESLPAWLVEVGKVLSASNESKIRAAHGHLTDVLDSVKGSGNANTIADQPDSPDMPEMSMEASESYSGSAMDASDGAYVLASLLRIISDEADEPDQVKLLMGAYDSVVAWMKAELAEIGTTEDQPEPNAGWSEWESLGRIVTAGLERLQEADAATKAEGGKNFPASDYAYVPDATKPSTWKLRLTATPGGDPDPGIVGAAAAALGPGFRGQKVEIPDADLAGVKAKVRAAWKKANPDKSADEMPDAIKEASAEVEIVGDLVPLTEASAVSPDGTARLKIIAPGWGSSGYYSPQLLERDGPKVFTSGMKMYWDHPTASEEAERPERSLRDLASELSSDATWDPNGPMGPGLYADAKVFGPYREAVNELAPHIGVSIRALGKAREGEAEGKKGRLIEQLVSGQSVDYVTSPGAGGQVLQLFESARERASHPAPSTPPGGPDMQELEEAKREIARLREANILRDAREVVTEALAAETAPDMTKARLRETLPANPPVKDGELDREALRTRVKEAVAAEVAYLAGATGSGAIRGFGVRPEIKPEEHEAALAASFKALGLSETAAAVAAKGRV